MVQLSSRQRASTPVENARGALLMTLSMAGFGINDIIIKYTANSIELGQTLLIRGMFATLFIWLLAKMTGKLNDARTLLDRPLLIRSLCELLTTLAFLTALFNMPIANATAILQALPLGVTLAAAFFLGEAIGWRRSTAIFVGFVGVLIVIRPGMEGFTIYSIFALAAVSCSIVRDITTRFIPRNISTLFVALYSSIIVTLTGAGMSVFEDWSNVDLNVVLWLGLASVFLIFGYAGIAGSMRVGDISVVVPFRYTILIYAIIAGIVIFDEIPDLLTILGSLIIVGTGIFTVYRERLFRGR